MAEILKIKQERPHIDVSHLPTVSFGPGSITWLGVMGMIVIEATVFAILLVSYFYLRSRSIEWPPHTNAPDLFWGTLNLIVFLLSVIPNIWYREKAKHGNLKAVRAGLIIMSLIGVLNVVIRYFELKHLNCDWSMDAYGSIVWTIMGMHLVHLLTDLVDTVVLTALFFTSLVEGRRFMDAYENADYWHFVVLTWIPIYLVVYWAPRWLHS